MNKMKRVWDTTQKKIAWVKDENGKSYQVWCDDAWESFFYFDKGKAIEVDSDMQIYGPTWKDLPETDQVGYYDSNEPTDIGTPEDTFVAKYTFEDYDETVLKTGKVKDNEVPVAPDDPTRKWYEFTWWKPNVKAITKDTTYVAQYKEIVTPTPEPETPGE